MDIELKNVDKIVSEAEPAVSLALSVLPAVNCAMQRCGTAFLRSVTVTNSTGSPMEDLQLRIMGEPEFLQPFSQGIALLPGDRPLTVNTPELTLNGSFLGEITERVTGVLRVQLCRGEEILGSASAEVAVQPQDQWLGTDICPELLAAFITPNHPALVPVLTRAAYHLGQWTGDTSLDAYQTQDPNRVLHQAAAVYAALREQDIHYSVPPASFEKTGQRVRLGHRVLEQKLGTCLDLSLLYAACLEAIGLHPLVITLPGHCIVGLWLEDRMFPESVQDDLSQITKRLSSGINEVAVVETTALTTGRDMTFDQARQAGEAALNNRHSECILDVRRARLGGVIPMSQTVSAEVGVETVEEGRGREQDAPQSLSKTFVPAQSAEEASMPKMVQWERKLLDLGLRNTLINLRRTRNQLPILSGSLDELENAFADGSDFTLMPRPGDWEGAEFTFEDLHERGSAEIVRAEFANHRLRTVLTDTELSRVVKELYRSAKTSLEENGANTLYLALGMLRWYESPRSTRARYAPIILLPVEMVRRSAAQGYVIRLRDEEPQMNITLLEKLKQDFGITVSGVDPLPGDEHGIDIRRVLNTLRTAVMDQRHWDVLETACLGIFSFSQFVMWNDLRSRSEDLMRNKVVRSLMEGRLAWDAQPLAMGDWVNEDGVLLPMAADASQLYAIRVACNGETFVLHGPPGTGKSQTITSLIANALAQGKRVLFVAEKLAALEVVQRRLDSIGIGAFCLELHSNKSRKRDVLEQLRQAAEVTKNTRSGQYALRAQQAADLRRELDGYARQLHSPLPCGSTLYVLISEYEKLRGEADIAAFDAGFLAEVTAEDMEQQRLTLERLTAAGAEAGHPHDHPLERVGIARYTQALRAQLPGIVNAYREQLQNIGSYVNQLANALGEALPQSYEQLERLCRIAGELALWYDLPRQWARAQQNRLYFDRVEQMAQQYMQAGQLRQQLLQSFRETFLTQDGERLTQELNAAETAWFLPRWMGRNRMRRQLGLYANEPVDKDTMAEHIERLRTYQQLLREADEAMATYGNDLGQLWQGEATDWQAVARAAEEARNSAQRLEALLPSPENLSRLGGDPALRDAVFALVQGNASLAEAKTAMDTLLGIVPIRQENWLAGELTLCDRILEHREQLREWIAYVAVREEAREMGLSNAVAYYASGADHGRVQPACRKALLRGLICSAIDGGDRLNQFSGTVFNTRIRQYRQIDQRLRQLSQEEIYCRLASRVPDFTREANSSSELGILQRSIKSGGRGVSIRRLFDQIPNLLPRLCPCMLMSPISAAQYLDPAAPPFDIVVFDEASQLPTCKAVGVLARGNDVVIVGDPKQMPPTSFFATNTADEDNLEAEDLESILDDCLALNMPQSHLLWHYRSRHESLIAFSNSRFYENKLFTFPSVNDRASMVRLVPVNGVFDRGKSRRNQKEAEAVVQELIRRAGDPEASGQSVGIVTFNINQQHLIDDLLSEACAEDPALEQWVYGGEEPVFIKNLENVQGDERDVILFSIGYGPDETGKVSMNFGPLNRDGGWRRLNVAVTRARQEILVFSTLRADQIDLNRTGAEGVAALRSFLEYAGGRTLALEETAARNVRRDADGIARSICRALGEAGYGTELSVGRSGYRVDVGVVDPEDPERYILGILLDGAGYGSARSTRDREVAQQSVLEGLGWRIHRIWSMDWWDNSQREIRKVLELLRQGETPPPAEAPVPEAPEIPVASVVTCPRSTEPAVYVATALEERPVSAESFTEPRYARGIRNRLERIVAQEAPISSGLLIRRVVQSYGISRAGNRIQSYVQSLIRELGFPETAQEDTVFYWRRDQQPQAYTGFRVGSEEENRRDPRDIPVQETANVLFEQVSMQQEDLLRETAKKLGYTRLGTNVLTALEGGIRYAYEQGLIAPGTGGNYILTPAGTERAN